MAEQVKRDRFKVVDLEFPVEINGKLWDKVTVRRMNVRETREWLEAQIAEGASAMVATPMVVDEAGLMVPAEVLDQLDADDWRVIDETVGDFMPRRLKELGAPPPATGADTSQS